MQPAVVYFRHRIVATSRPAVGPIRLRQSPRCSGRGNALSLYSSIFSGVTSITVARSLTPFFLAHRLVTDDVLTECVLDLSGVAPVSRVADEPGRSVTSAQGRVSRASRKYRMRNCTGDEGAPSSSRGAAPKVERGPTTDIHGTNSKLPRSRLKPPQYQISTR